MLKSNLSIAQRLTLAFSLLTIATIGLSLVAIEGVREISAQKKRLAFEALPTVRLAATLRADVLSAQGSISKHILHKNSDEMASEHEFLQNKLADVGNDLAELKKLINSEAERELVDRFSGEWSAYSASVPVVMERSRDGHKEEALALSLSASATGRAAASTLTEIVRTNDQEVAKIVAAAESVEEFA